MNSVFNGVLYIKLLLSSSQLLKDNPSCRSLSGVNSEAVCVADRQPEESLESILMALDDDK